MQDAGAAYRWLLAQGIEPANLAVAGDSAGGGLAVATLVELRDEGGPLPAAAVVFSPWVDLEANGVSMRTRADLDVLITRDAGLQSAATFLQGADPRDPLAAPLHADLRGLPPLYVQVGDHEVLLDDATRLAAAAERAGVDVRLDVFPEMQHVFQVCAGNMPEADEALARAGTWLAAHLRLTEGSARRAG